MLGEPDGRFMIVNQVNRTMKLIEDDDLHDQVVRRMLDAGIRVFDRLSEN
jgi:hypothetical protein